MMYRLPLITAIIIVAVLVTPYALQPGINSADLIWLATPVAVLLVGWPRGRSRTLRRPVSEQHGASGDDTHTPVVSSPHLHH